MLCVTAVPDIELVGCTAPRIAWKAFRSLAPLPLISAGLSESRRPAALPVAGAEPWQSGRERPPGRDAPRVRRAGHSLGGAVAVLTTLRLLRQLPPGAGADVRCVSFATPAIGNARLQAYVREQGWERHFANLLVPGAGRQG
jgi:hypothetical protein